MEQIIPGNWGDFRAAVLDILKIVPPSKQTRDLVMNLRAQYETCEAWKVTQNTGAAQSPEH
jgi:hypothetical protein